MSKRRERKRLRASYAIVCEGYTEWFYFDYVKSNRRYPFKLKPEMPVHSSYKYIFEKAKSLLGKAEYNVVFCVFDLDKIKSDNKLDAFVNDCKKLRTKKIIPILSFPCIEVWFLFHYMNKFSSRYYGSYEEILKPLRVFVPDYCKEKEFYQKGTFFKNLNSAARLQSAHLWAEKSLENIEGFRDAFDKTFTEIGCFEKFLEQCKACVDNLQNCESCLEKYFSNIIAKQNSKLASLLFRLYKLSLLN